MGAEFDDDTPTPPRGSEHTPNTLRRHGWGDTKRVEVGLTHRRAETSTGASLASERRRADLVVQQLGNGVVDEIEAYEVTSPVDLLERDLDSDDLPHVQKLRSERADPYALAYRLSKEIARLKREDRSANKTQADQILELLERPPHEDVKKLQDRITELERRDVEREHAIAPIRSLGRWALTVAAGALLTVGIFLYSRGFSEGGAAAKFEALAKVVEELRVVVLQLQLQRHSSITPAIAPDAISSAGPITPRNFK